MLRTRQPFRPTLAWIVLSLVVSMTQGCARPDALHRQETGGNAAVAGKAVPFHQSPEHASDDSPAVPPDGKPTSSTPFHASSRARILPAGTLITVRLEDSLSILQVHAGDAFAASVAGPITQEGDIVISGGAMVSGRIEFAQPSVPRPGMSPDPGYVRIRLHSITVEGRLLALQTSSLFAKGTLQASDLQVLKGRRLTFRLTAPLVLADPRSIANAQSSNASSE